MSVGSNAVLDFIDFILYGQNSLFYVPQKKEGHTDLEQHESK